MMGNNDITRRNFLEKVVKVAAIVVVGNLVSPQPSGSRRDIVLDLEDIADSDIADSDVVNSDVASSSLGDIRQVLIVDFLSKYLPAVTKVSGYYKALRNEHGEDSILQKYVSDHELCLEFAQREGLVEGDYQLLGNTLAERQHVLSTSVGGHVDYRNTDVIAAMTIAARGKVDFFGSLLEEHGNSVRTDDAEGNVRGLIQAIYDRESFGKYVADSIKNSDRLFSALKGTLGWEKLFGGGHQIDRIAQCTREHYAAGIPKFFPEKN